MKCILLLLIALGARHIVFSQSCTFPKPLTAPQQAMVKGDWKGYYEVLNTKTAFTVSIDFTGDSDFVNVSNPPLEGTFDLHEHRFCGAGAFHFKKAIGDNYFEFDGVPTGEVMKGTLTVLIDGTKKSGKFYLSK